MKLDLEPDLDLDVELEPDLKLQLDLEPEPDLDLTDFDSKLEFFGTPFPSQARRMYKRGGYGMRTSLGEGRRYI